MDYLKILEHSFSVSKEIFECPPESRLEYLGDHFFDFTTYDGEMSFLFAQKAVEVCQAINNMKTFEYIENGTNYKWFLLMCNMPFFSDKLEWGTSIRGAWWDHKIEFSCLGLWDGDTQLSDTMTFDQDEWMRFISAVIEFAKNKI
jgi:hypothetical protein